MSSLNSIALIALCALFAGSASAFSTGAPAEVCVSLTPDHHGVKTQAIPSPYTIQVSQSAAKAGDVLIVSIVGQSGNDTIKGFLLEARSAAAGSTEAIGEFRVEASDVHTQTRDCGKNPKSAVTHKKATGAPPAELTFKWVAPKISGPVEFIGTVAHEWNVFWVGVKSEKVVITA